MKTTQTKAQKEKARQYNKEWRAKNKERDSEWHRNYYRKNRKRLLAKMREYRKRYYKEHPEKTVEYQFKKKYGLTLDAFKEMAKQQRHRCAICKRKKKLNVDHCHKTGKVRGLLCTSCNTALGAFRDSPDVVKVALSYLRRAA